MAAQLRLCSRQTDHGGPGQYCNKICFSENTCIAKISYTCSSVVALWTYTVKVTGSNQIFKILNSFLMLFTFCTVYSTFRLKAPGSNPLDNIKCAGGISQYDSLPLLLYLLLCYV